jgi:hypothetical protein
MVRLGKVMRGVLGLRLGQHLESLNRLDVRFGSRYTLSPYGSDLHVLYSGCVQ